MNPLDFLQVADNLKDSPEEAERRTAVSRTYYAVYHYIKVYLSKNRIPESCLGHEKLIHCIKNSGIEKAKELGQMLADLKADRHKADYKLDLIGKFNENTCNLLFCKAQETIKEFKKCRGRPLIDGINNYRKRIGEVY